MKIYTTLCDMVDKEGGIVSGIQSLLRSTGQRLILRFSLPPLRGRIPPALILILALLWPYGPAVAGIEGKIFPFVTYSRLTGVPGTTDLDKEQLTRGADLFGLATYKEWRVLGEIMVDNTEGDPERLQFGRWIGNNTLLWIGRWHTPTAYWDMIYHHSPFLQTSITRPEIMNYEDDGGILATHIWGILADETIPRGNGEWQFHLGVGAAPQLTPDILVPVEALNPVSINHRVGVTFVAAYMPDTSMTDEVGLFASSMDIPSEMPGINKVRQTEGGAYFNWTVGNLHTISSIFDVHDDVQNSTGATDSHGFITGYAYLEYQWGPRWRPYVRYEGSINANSDPYVSLFPHGLADSRFVGGVRYELTNRQALTVEAIRSEYEGDLHYNQFMLQWSAMFP